MKLLFATSIVPTTSVGSGYEIANQAILDGLRRAGVDVTVVGFAWPGQPLADPQNTIALGEIDVRTDTAPLPLRLEVAGTGHSAGATFSSSKLMEVLGGEASGSDPKTRSLRWRRVELGAVCGRLRDRVRRLAKPLCGAQCRNMFRRWKTPPR